MSQKQNGSLTTILIIAVVLIGGFFIISTSKKNAPQQAIPGEITNQDSTQHGQYKGNVIAGSTSPYLEFNKEDYEKAFASDKIVFLNFYADWCPICRAEFPEIAKGFDELTVPAVGFLVNYNDANTSEDEKSLAREFGVTYQHTKIILKNGNKILGPIIEQWNKEKLIDEIQKAQ